MVEAIGDVDRVTIFGGGGGGGGAEADEHEDVEEIEDFRAEGLEAAAF